MTDPVYCKFYRIGTCNKGTRCPFVHDREASGEVVCSFFQSGSCRYGDYCALPHVKAKVVSSPSPLPPFSRGGRPILEPEEPILGLAQPTTSLLTGKPSLGPGMAIPTSSAPYGLGTGRMTVAGPVSASYTSTSHHSDLGYTSEQSVPLPLDFDDDDDFDARLQEDMPILPSLLDDLLTPTELLQLSNTRVETTAKATRPAVGVFSYSAVTKVGASTSKQPERIKPKTVDASHSAIIAAHAPELPPVLLEPTGTYVPFEAREPLCPFAIHGNCRFGETCRYLHGAECFVCKKRVLHPNATFEEHQEHVAECQRTREKLETLKEHGTITDHKECVVCMEVVVTKKDPRFGIMNCEHCVCLGCIRNWRTRETMDTSKTCPICRTVTHFVTPSTIWPPDPETKRMMIEEYKTKLAGIDCRHYNLGDGNCPFGSSCFYRHVDREGRSQENDLRMVKGDGEDVRVVGTLKLSDYLAKYDEGRNR